VSNVGTATGFAVDIAPIATVKRRPESVKVP
jgi:hypothetical protein